MPLDENTKARILEKLRTEYARVPTWEDYTVVKGSATPLKVTFSVLGIFWQEENLIFLLPILHVSGLDPLADRAINFLEDTIRGWIQPDIPELEMVEMNIYGFEKLEKVIENAN